MKLRIIKCPICGKGKFVDVHRKSDLISFLNEQTEAVTEYSVPLARKLIEKITTCDDKLVVELKPELMVKVEA